MKTYIWHGDLYEISDEKIENGDFVLTEKYGVWIFQDETGDATAPMPFWANRKNCKKLIFIKNIEK